MIDRYHGEHYDCEEDQGCVGLGDLKFDVVGEKVQQLLQKVVLLARTLEWNQHKRS